jgi:hypothetical protein
LIPCLTHALARSKTVELPFDVKEAIFECLVAKAGLEKDYCQRDLLEARQLLRGDESLPKYLEVAMVHRQSVIARLNADYIASCSVIDDYMSNSTMDCHTDRRAHAWYLRLFVSRLRNLCLQENFKEAHDDMEKWNMPLCPSLMERKVVISYSLVASEIERSLGRLKLAKAYLEDCYRYPILSSDPNQYQIVGALVDVRCATEKVDEAEYLVKTELKKLPSCNRLAKAQRRLLVSSLDVDIARMSRSSFADARSKICQLKAFFNEMTGGDISDQLLHIRTLTASARIHHLERSFAQAIEEWDEVKTLAKKYSAFRDKGFTFAFSQFSIGCAFLHIALEALKEANFVFRSEKDNYWIPMITTDWLPKRRREIANLVQSTALE